MVERVRAHLAAYLGDVASLPGGALADEGGVTWTTTGIWWPMFNGAVAAPDATPGALAKAAAAMRACEAPWFHWVLPDTPQAAIEVFAAAGGEEFDKQAPWMEAEIVDLQSPALPERVTVREVETEEDQRVWAATLREIYGFPEIGEEGWTVGPLKESSQEQAGFFATVEGERLYAKLGFKTDGWVTRWLGGMEDPPAISWARR